VCKDDAVKNDAIIQSLLCASLEDIKALFASEFETAMSDKPSDLTVATYFQLWVMDSDANKAKLVETYDNYIRNITSSKMEID
jgi:hypothetical protein